MYNSRTIARYLKKIDENSYVNIEFLDKINPNTFDLTKNGKIQSSTFGSFSNILIKINVINTKEDQFNEVEYALYPDRLGVICSKVLAGRLNSFSTQNRKMPEYKGELHKTIYTSKVNGTQFECALLNIYYLEDEDCFVFGIKVGLGDLVKDETNRNDFTNFNKTNYVGIKIPYDEMETICYQIDKYLDTFRLTMYPIMMSGRSSYEAKCKTIYKKCIGDVQKIREITEKFNKLSKLEQDEILSGKKAI